MVEKENFVIEDKCCSTVFEVQNSPEIGMVIEVGAEFVTLGAEYTEHPIGASVKNVDSRPVQFKLNKKSADKLANTITHFAKMVLMYAKEADRNVVNDLLDSLTVTVSASGIVDIATLFGEQFASVFNLTDMHKAQWNITFTPTAIEGNKVVGVIDVRNLRLVG